MFDKGNMLYLICPVRQCEDIKGKRTCIERGTRVKVTDKHNDGTITVFIRKINCMFRLPEYYFEILN